MKWTSSLLGIEQSKQWEIKISSYDIEYISTDRKNMEEINNR